MLTNDIKRHCNYSLAWKCLRVEKHRVEERKHCENELKLKFPTRLLFLRREEVSKFLNENCKQGLDPWSSMHRHVKKSALYRAILQGCERELCQEHDLVLEILRLTMRLI